MQALTRVNRPYKDIAHGYVVDFADITEEYDKTNRAYLTELTGELGDVIQEYSSLFEDPKTVEHGLAAIKNFLFDYSTDNVVEFQHEITPNCSDQIANRPSIPASKSPSETSGTSP